VQTFQGVSITLPIANNYKRLCMVWAETPRYVERIMQGCREVAAQYSVNQINALQVADRFIELQNDASFRNVTLQWSVVDQNVTYSVRYAIPQ